MAPKRRTCTNRWADPSPLSILLTNAHPGRRPDDRKLVDAFAWWDRAVSRRVAEHARPVHFGRGTLTVHTKNAAWASELSFLEAQLVKSIRKRAPEAGVRRIRFRVGRMPPTPPRPPPPPPKVKPLPLEALPAELARELAQIGDDRLRDAVGLAARFALAPRPPEGK